MLRIRSEKHERERKQWIETCQTHVLLLTTSQRVCEDLDAEVKKLRRNLEGKDTELAEAVKRSENQAGDFRNELEGSQEEAMEPNLVENIADLQNDPS